MANVFRVPTTVTVEDLAAAEQLYISALTKVRFSDGQEYSYDTEQAKLRVIQYIRKSLAGNRRRYGAILPFYSDMYRVR